MMKHTTIIVFCLLLTSALFASSTQLFEQGNKNYQEANYEQAVESYLSVINNGVESFELYFNLGNAYYKSENIASAILYYEKALKLMPGNEDAKFNLRLATLQTVDKIEPLDQLFLNSWWEKTLNFTSADNWGKVCILLLFIGFGLLCIYLLVGNVALKKVAFFSGASLIVIGLVTLLLASSQNHRMNTQSQAIIFTPNVTVKSAPGSEGNDLFVIHEGTKVTLLQETNGWLEITLTNGNAGWVKASDLEKI